MDLEAKPPLGDGDLVTSIPRASLTTYIVSPDGSFHLDETLPSLDKTPRPLDGTPGSIEKTPAPLDEIPIEKEKEGKSQQAIAYLHLAEGLPESARAGLRALVPGIPDTFFDAHLDNSLAQTDNSLDEKRAVILARWSRVAHQPKEIWLREQRLQTKGPYNVNDADPVKSRLDHERYDHISDPYRGYVPLSEVRVLKRVEHPVVPATRERHLTEKTFRANILQAVTDLEAATATAPEPAAAARTETVMQDMVIHIANECISAYRGTSEDSTPAFLILFDAPRQHRIAKMSYNIIKGGDPTQTATDGLAFPDDKSYRGQFLRILLGAAKGLTADVIPDAIANAIVKIVLDDQACLLSSISNALDNIELSPYKRTSVPKTWRDDPPRWRNHLFHQLQSLTYLSDLLTSTPTTTTTTTTPQLKALEAAAKNLEAMTRRLEGSYQLLMSAMSILESEKAIDQAVVVTRLTNLAFFFIPLSFVASLFGMNVNEFDQRLTVWLWVVVSAAVMGLTYFIRFRAPLGAATAAVPEAIASWRWDLFVARLRRWAQVARPFMRPLWTVVFYAVLGAVLWLGSTRLRTDETKIGVVAALAVVPRLLSPLSGWLLFRGSLACLGTVQRVAAAAFYSGVAVAIWGVATCALPIETRIGLALGVVVFPSLFTTPWRLFGRRRFVGFFFRYDDSISSPSSSWTDIIVYTSGIAMWAAVGVSLWKLFSSTASDATKIGVAIGLIGFPLITIGPLLSFHFEDEKSFHLARLSLYAVRLGFSFIFGVMFWRLCISPLSVDAKVGVGASVIVSLFLIVDLIKVSLEFT
ncbi:hypothetical protein B0T18DRAFT_167344 [Schizothecium vesticola]|uniref:Uncharacterized protein n=1 Tax=Schizothecium vesticola TaxID=314040 RepID=A0AA40ENJ7_9PEZI|nr:hypothetical protein B0T18DRAFT_167344 [Schizothecium vesticola]